MSDRFVREMTIRHRVGRNCTRLALTQPAALLGRHGSRTRTQHRPRASLAARVTISQEAFLGRTVRTDRRPCPRSLTCTGAGRTIRARQASAAVGCPTAVFVASARVHPTRDCAAAGANANAMTTTAHKPAQRLARGTTIRSPARA
ncbi:MAG: hypothetical protein ABW167_20315 [Baekduia sp.]